MLPQSRSPLVFALVLLGLPVACSEGGERKLPQSEVQLTANHHVWLLSTLPKFSEFPIPEAETVECYGTFAMNSDSTYDVKLNGCSGGAENYALRETGELAIIVTPSPRSGSISFVGAYGIEGETGVYYFTDRFTSSALNSIAMFWGTRLEPEIPTLEGSWHAFSLHIIHSSSQTFTTANVARTVAGAIVVDSSDNITGMGEESTNNTIDFTGLIAGMDEGAVELTLNYDNGQTNDARKMLGGAAFVPGSTTPNLVLGLDQDTNDGEAGLFALMQLRTDTASRTAFAGTYFLGTQHVRIDPTVRESKIGHGTITFDATGGFEAEIVRVSPIETVEYAGSYTLADDGTLTLQVNDLNETWAGAVDQDYKNVIIVDNEGDHPTKSPEVMIGLGIRQKEANP